MKISGNKEREGLFPSFISRPKCFKIKSIVSLVIETASTTVGTPIAITGIPNVSLLSSLRLFPTPDPG